MLKNEIRKTLTANDLNQILDVVTRVKSSLLKLFITRISKKQQKTKKRHVLR